MCVEEVTDENLVANIYEKPVIFKSYKEIRLLVDENMYTKGGLYLGRQPLRAIAVSIRNMNVECPTVVSRL